VFSDWLTDYAFNKLFSDWIRKDRVGLIENPDENKSSEYTWAPIKCETKRNEINEMKTK
jgi:hypothetical protein